MKSRLSKPVAALLITVSASALANEYPPDPSRSDTDSSDYSQPENNSNAGPTVPGRSYRDQAPPRYRIEQGSGSSTKAFPRVPGRSYRDYSRPSYNTRQ